MVHAFALTGLVLTALIRRLVPSAGAPPARPSFLRVAGLGQEVRICRDASGVAQIFAADERDAAFGLGVASV